jgi:general secretion pathway protein D
VLTNPELQMVLHAMDQRGNTDLLSAPRVTTLSGINAVIEVVREIIYPTEFDVSENDIEIQGGGGQTGANVPFIPPTVIPGAFETREVGVILNVTPTVNPDNYTINLQLLPEIAELVDWIQYGTTIGLDNGQQFVVNMPQPVFASRNVTTSMTVCDGYTVVMGGLIREDLVTIKDKIPLLGDIPVLGRLFRTDGSKSEKRNLLIFVTARLVDPAGNPVNKQPAVNQAGSTTP